MTMAFELYNAPQSTCSQKVRMTLAEKGFAERGVDWVDHHVDLGKFEQLKPEYLALNPNGVVPTLVHDGEVLIESSAIVEYLDEVLPEPPLAPPDALGRARMRAWLRYIDEVPTPAVRVPTFANLLAPMRFAKASDDAFREHAAKLPLRKEFYERMSQSGFKRDDFENAMLQLRQTCERIAQAIRDTGGPWVMGAQFTQADILLMPAIDRMDDLGYADRLWGDLPETGAWFARLRERPSYAAAVYPGARMSDRYPEHFRTAAEVEAVRGY
jgi:glutathione S-transferase